MLKIISITLPEKMIRQIDEILINGEFSSRSEFFRILLWMWFLKSEEKVSIVPSEELPNKHQSEVDFEYGIPPELVRKYVEKAKSLNK